MGLPTYHLANVVDDHLMGGNSRYPRRGVAQQRPETHFTVPLPRVGSPCDGTSAPDYESCRRQVV